MYQAAYAIKLFNNNDACSLSTASFSELTQHAVWGAQLNMDNQVVATHQELAMMRQCAAHAMSKHDHVVHVISSYTQKQIYYLVKTLMHFGISCGQIIVRRPSEDNDCPDGVWLFVEDISAAK
jgi:hypothetical protein